MIPPIGGWPESDDSRPLLIGVTGPIGCGKSTVAGILHEIGGTIIDADDLAREATKPGSATLPAIRERFGDTVFDEDGSLHRAALAKVVFADAVALADLERIVHPAVRVLAEGIIEGATRDRVPFVVMEAIKLAEGDLADRCDEIWIITCDPSTQRARLIGRGATADDITRRISTQGDDLVERLGALLEGRAPVRLVSTEGTLDETRERVEDLLAESLDRPIAGQG